MTLSLLPLSSLKPAAKQFLLIGLLLAESGMWGALLGAPLPKGLPRGLEKPPKGLEELALPPSVDRLDWVPRQIRTLNASGKGIHSLKGLPGSLRELDVSYTQIQSLESIPSSVRVLDIRETRIEHLVGFPPKLESLKISNQNIVRLGKLPPSLQELHLENTRICDLAGIPSRLRTLYIEGESLENLDGLPETLQSLTLIATKVRSLKGLPPSLQKLKLEANRDLQFNVGDLPALLTWLSLDLDLPSPNLDLSGLRYLAWYSDRRAGQKYSSFPSFLSSLTLRAPKRESLPFFPRSLRALGLLTDRWSPLDSLPPELEVLDLTGSPRAEIASLRYLVHLKELELDYSSLSALPELPGSLERLVISGVKIKSLPLLPAGLSELIFCDSKLEQLEAKSLPPNLSRLDLCNSRSLRTLSSIPKDLIYLNLGGTSISDLPKLAGNLSLQELDVSNTKIEHLDLYRLPRELESLTVSEGQLDSLAGLPSTVKTLRIVESERN